MNRLAYPLPEAARIAGVSRTRIFEAVRKQPDSQCADIRDHNIKMQRKLNQQREKGE